MPSLDAPFYYGRCLFTMPLRTDNFFKGMSIEPVDDTGNVESPVGFVALLKITGDDIAGWVLEDSSDAWAHLQEVMAISPGWYVTRQDNNGLIWAMFYGVDSTWAEELARDDFAEAVAAYEIWEESDV